MRRIKRVEKQAAYSFSLRITVCTAESVQGIRSISGSAELCDSNAGKFKKMEQELINIIDEIRATAHQVAHTYTREIAHKDMDVDQWALLQEALMQINLKSQEAFLMVAILRRNIPA